MSRTLILMEPPQQQGHPCVSEECLAGRDLICAADGLTHLLLPNSMSYPSYAALVRAQRHFARNAQAVGIEHPDRIPIYCKLLARVAPTVTGPVAKDDPAGYTDRLTTNLLYFAIRLDRPGNHCLANVLAALPRTPVVQNELNVRDALTCSHRMRACKKEYASPP